MSLPYCNLKQTQWFLHYAVPFFLSETGQRKGAQKLPRSLQTPELFVAAII